MDNIKFTWKRMNVLYKLLTVNVAVFIVIAIIKLFAFLFGAQGAADAVVRFFSLPANPLKILIKPWTVVTYMFMHEGFWHLLANMLWLYFLGLMFVMSFGQKELWRVYLLGGLMGALFYVAGFNLFPVFAPYRYASVLLGASAAVSAIVLAVSVYKPTQIVMLFGILPVPLWLIGALYVLYDLSMLTVDNPGGHLSHLGGALFGVWFALKYKQGKDITLFLTNISFRRKGRMKVHKNDYRPQDYEWNERRHEIKQELDRILEKISRKGYNSLTRREREFLKRHSRDF